METEITKSIINENVRATDSKESQQLKPNTSSNKFEWYQIINRNVIEGPYHVTEIIARVIRKDFSDTLWVRKCKKSAQWYKLDLNQLGKFHGKLCLDSTFNSNCLQLYNKLQNILTMNIYHHNKYPGSENNDTKCCFFDGWFWTFLNWSLFIFMTLHINISVIFAALWRLYCHQNNILFILACILVTINAIGTSVIICYFGFIYTKIYNEFQSWMIAYIAWIAIIMFQWSVAGIREQFKYNKVGVLLSTIRMKILGISLQQKKILFTNWREDLWIISITSLLPSTIVGFLANFFWEEKFLLECDQSWETGDLCYEDGKACCKVISSYDINNLFDFAGKFASNILAAFGVIRIVAWFMVKRNKKIRHMVVKKK